MLLQNVFLVIQLKCYSVQFRYCAEEFCDIVFTSAISRSGFNKRGENETWNHEYQGKSYSCLYDIMLLKFSIVAKWNLNNLMKIFIVQKAILYDNVQYQFLRLNLEMGCVGETKLVV